MPKLNIISPKLHSPLQSILYKPLQTLIYNTNNYAQSNVLSTLQQNKTSKVVKSLLDFDEIKPNKKKPLVTIDKSINHLLSQDIRQQILSFCTYSDYELDKLILLFDKHQYNNIISIETYWTIISKAIPLIACQDEKTTIKKRINQIFTVSNINGITQIEFILSISILNGRSIFLSTSTFVCDLLNSPNENNILLNTIDIIKVKELFNDSSILFNIFCLDRYFTIRNKELILAWEKFLFQLSPDGIVEKHVLEEALNSHPSAIILLFPFKFQYDISNIY